MYMLALLWIDGRIDAWVVAKDLVNLYPFRVDDSLPPELGKRVGDLNDLPEELRRQLQIGKVGALDQQIIGMIRDEYDGVANVDEILVGLFKATKQIHQRQQLANKLYRMGQAGQIVSVPKRKGVYRTR